MSPETLIEDEDALARTEAAASDYLADGAITALVDAYVDHLRKVGIEALRRRPRPKREEAALRREGPRFRTATHGIDPAELDKLEAKLARDREIVARRVFQASTLDDLSLETGVTKERVRQITKRAARTIAEIAAADPRFAVMSEYGRPAATKRRQPAQPTASLLPDAQQPHNLLASIRAIQPAELGVALAAPAESVERVEAVLLLHAAVPSRAVLH